MQEIVKIDESIDQEKLSRAEENHKEILARTYVVAGNLLELGKLFKAMRDDKLYKLLGASTFTEYCGFPEIHYARPTIYSFIGIYERYVLKLKITTPRLLQIGHRMLQIINPVVEEDPDFWLDNAEVLSESDLINAVRGFQDKPPMMPKPKEEENEDKCVYPFSFKEYLDFIRSHPCIICKNEESEAAHFPRSMGAGANEVECIPLCRACHSEYHQDSFDFLYLYKDKIFQYFYNLFIKCFALIKSYK